MAKNRDGSAIVGPALEEITYDDLSDPGASMHPLTYAAATHDKSQATLTVRLLYDDAPVVIPPSDWDYDDDGTAVHLLPGNRKFEQSKLYEFTYSAKDPARRRARLCRHS